MKRKAWLTPDSLPMDTICRQTVMPNSPEWTSAVNGALLPLTYPSSWEQFGSLTPDETAARFSEMYWQWYASECGGACPAPTLPTGQRIYRINPATQRWEWLTADDTWEEPTGEDAIPAPDARTETTSEERICAAASNVVNIIRELYDTVVTDANNSLDASQAAANIGAAIGAWISARIFPPAAAYIAAAAGAWNAFYEIAAVVVMDLWNDSFEDAYKCALISNATDTGGVVTFDFFGVNRQVASEIFWSGQYVLLVSQVLYIHYVIGSDGLNLAGSKGNVAGDCAPCDEWCYTFDFADSPQGWSTIRETPGILSPGGVWNTGGWEGTIQVNDLGARQLGVTIAIRFPSTTITKIELTYSRQNGQLTQQIYANRWIMGRWDNGVQVGGNSTVVRADLTPGAQGTDIVLSNTGEWLDCRGLSIAETASYRSGANPAPIGSLTIKRITLEGLGDNPFGENNCAGV